MVHPNLSRCVSMCFEQINRNWLVVYLPLWKIWVRQLGWWHSQVDGKIIQTFQTTNQLVSLSIPIWTGYITAMQIIATCAARIAILWGLGASNITITTWVKWSQTLWSWWTTFFCVSLLGIPWLTWLWKIIIFREIIELNGPLSIANCAISIFLKKTTEASFPNLSAQILRWFFWLVHAMGPLLIKCCNRSAVSTTISCKSSISGRGQVVATLWQKKRLKHEANMRNYKMVLSCFIMFYHVLSIYPYYFKEKLTSIVSISVTTDMEI